MSQSEAFEKVKSGEIAATASIAGKPVRSVLKLSRNDGLHFVQIPYTKELNQLIGDFLPATLTHDRTCAVWGLSHRRRLRSWRQA
jgi:uncharacterized protein